MAILKINDIKEMGKEEREKKLKELRFELIKANVTANRTNAKTKEIKRAISRILTLNNSSRKEKLKKQK